MKVHHIGYAVFKIEEAIEKFNALGFEVDEIIKDESRKVYITFARNGDTIVELIAPFENGSPIDNVLEKNGATPYHICYEVNDIDTKCKELKKDGWVLLRKAATAPAISNYNVAFLYNKTIGLIELVEIKN